jgi:uncharacterized membrane protein YebE (DUF533 family)
MARRARESPVTIERLLGSVIKGALTGRRKRSGKTLRYLTGGRGSFLNASTLLAVAGVAWGLYETSRRQEGAAAATGVGALPPTPGGVGPLVSGGSVPPPVPGAASEREPPPPPVQAVGRGGPPVAVPAAVERVIRLTVSAARADGILSGAERTALVEHARAVGAEAIVDDELSRPTPLARIVAGVDHVGLREELYTLAFALVRADETVSGAERIYLAQLAHALGLDAGATTRLEAAASGRLAGGDEGED